MPDEVNRAAKRRQLEDKLTQAIAQRQQEWSAATGDARDVARKRLMESLREFHALILERHHPEE